MKLSFVIPCYRSENTISAVVQEIRETIATRPSTEYEIVLVNDCSPDNVWQVIKKLAAEDTHIKGICLAKNFGQHSALMAGYGQATGDYIISLDDDGQTPASESFKLVDKIEEGYDVVYGYYRHSAQHLFRRFGSWVNKKMAEAIIGQPKTLHTTSFFIMRKFIADEIVRYPHPFAYISGLVFRATKSLGNVEVEHRHRIEGESGYTLLRPRRLRSRPLCHLQKTHVPRSPRWLHQHARHHTLYRRHDHAFTWAHRRIHRPHLHQHQSVTAIRCARTDVLNPSILRGLKPRHYNHIMTAIRQNKHP